MIDPNEEQSNGDRPTPLQQLQLVDPQPLLATDITLIATHLQQTLQRSIMDMLNTLHQRRALPNPRE